MNTTTAPETQPVNSDLFDIYPVAGRIGAEIVGVDRQKSSE